ncbi:hypothetical protein B296_00024671 [Ensete ventricosum]|uniref:Uncharacterized protein n=1 Tax=Ensete ventricosum TaxID=4639 RepID=A0A426Z261_ENSVE|nr:hypothetical protein B296_00024671 [Ensete ventricosum]
MAPQRGLFSPLRLRQRGQRVVGRVSFHDPCGAVGSLDWSADRHMSATWTRRWAPRQLIACLEFAWLIYTCLESKAVESRGSPSDADVDEAVWPGLDKPPRKSLSRVGWAEKPLHRR